MPTAALGAGGQVGMVSRPAMERPLSSRGHVRTRPGRWLCGHGRAECVSRHRAREGWANAGSGRCSREFDPRPAGQYLRKRNSTLGMPVAAVCVAMHTGWAFRPKRGDGHWGSRWARGGACRASTGPQKHGAERRSGRCAWRFSGDTQEFEFRQGGEFQISATF